MRLINRSKEVAVNVVTIKWGTLYGPQYVNRLRASVERNLSIPFRFVCFTDDVHQLDERIETYPLPPVDIPDVPTRSSNWRKLGLYQSGIGDLNGLCLYLDLDIVVVGSIDCFFDYEPEKFCAVSEWVQAHRKVVARRPAEYNTSVFRFEAGTTQKVVDRFHQEGERILRDFRREQQFVTNTVKDSIQPWPSDWVVSFKRQCLPAFPMNLIKPPALPPLAKIVVFHGHPNPDQAAAGYRDGPWHRKCLATPWVRDHWR